jgi:hypothetical protein
MSTSSLFTRTSRPPIGSSSENKISAQSVTCRNFYPAVPNNRSCTIFVADFLHLFMFVKLELRSNRQTHNLGFYVRLLVDLRVCIRSVADRRSTVHLNDVCTSSSTVSHRQIATIYHCFYCLVSVEYMTCRRRVEPVQTLFCRVVVEIRTHHNGQKVTTLDATFGLRVK